MSLHVQVVITLIELVEEVLWFKITWRRFEVYWSILILGVELGSLSLKRAILLKLIFISLLFLSGTRDHLRIQRHLFHALRSRGFRQNLKLSRKIDGR